MTNGDLANGMGSEVQELQMLTGSGELMGYSFADGSEPKGYETVSFATGTAKKFKKKKGSLVNNFRKNQTKRQGQRATDSKNTAEAIKAMQKTASQPTPKLAPLPKKKAGLSMGAKVGIGAGIALVLGVAGFLIYKHVKK